MTYSDAIFTSTCHTKQLNPWPNSSVSRVVKLVIHSQLSTCQGKMGPFIGHKSTCGHQTGLKKARVKADCSNFRSIQHMCCWCIDVANIWHEKCAFKLCVYNTHFGKSGYKYTNTYNTHMTHKHKHIRRTHKCTHIRTNIYIRKHV